MKNKERDVYLDDIRAIGMLWVIFVHSVYWTNLFISERGMLIRSLFLIEMPILFFAMGASNSLSGIDSYPVFIKKRIRRIYIPYAVYIFFCWLLSLEKLAEGGSASLFRLLFLVDFTLPFAHLGNMLWFLPHYIILISLYPFFRKVKEKTCTGPVFRLLPILFLYFGMFYTSKQPSYWNYFFVYSFWVYLGIYYREIKNSPKTTKVFFLVFLGNVFGVFILHYKFQYGFDMQFNKFPPNIMFQTYNLMLFSAFIVFRKAIFSFIQRVKEKYKYADWIFRSYGQYSYSIFLMQGLALTFIQFGITFLSLSPIFGINEFVSLGIYLILFPPVAAVFGRIFYTIEKLAQPIRERG